jgi:hypothetical protein
MSESLSLTQTVPFEEVAQPAPARELNVREGDGLTISLFWRPDDKNLYVQVADRKSVTLSIIEVRDNNPVEVFEHPLSFRPDHVFDLPVEDQTA